MVFPHKNLLEWNMFFGVLAMFGSLWLLPLKLFGMFLDDFYTRSFLDLYWNECSDISLHYCIVIVDGKQRRPSSTALTSFLSLSQRWPSERASFLWESSRASYAWAVPPQIRSQEPIELQWMAPILCIEIMEDSFRLVLQMICEYQTFNLVE